ncbi:MAG: hypothetical protein MUD01_16230 [Chloroflexaceae bacterium]|jgi:nicotinamide mononucleotide (NMN) deamidase PncC|nr:hypothetical protein [Chloroflexaceae bacterium]
MLPADIETLITNIHAAPPRLVLEFAGAGSLALWWLHSVAGSSRTVLEATDRYAPQSLATLLGFTPVSFVSVDTALAMARQAQARATALSDGSFPLLGVGCTATIATDRAKRGEHRCCIAVCAATATKSYALTLTKGQRDRYGEEELVSRVLIHAIAQACALPSLPPLPLAPAEVVQQQTH